mgnify:CR=1 FL=1
MIFPQFKKISFKSYKPGKSQLSRIKNIIKLSANESALGSSPKAKKVINSKKPTKLNLHIGPAQIGVIKNIITIIIFNLLSIILSQLLLP